MNKKKIIKLTNLFNAIVRQIPNENTEFLYAWDLMEKLGYTKWQDFVEVVTKAKTACYNSGQEPGNHFSQVGKMVKLGSGSRREIEDYQLSRYACYLIARNSDPSKSVIANGQTYFANWLRNRNTVEFLGISEKAHNPGFNYGEFATINSQTGDKWPRKFGV